MSFWDSDDNFSRNHSNWLEEEQPLNLVPSQRSMILFKLFLVACILASSVAGNVSSFCKHAICDIAWHLHIIISVILIINFGGTAGFASVAVKS